MKPTFTKKKNESGQALTEYVVIVFLVAVGAIAMSTSLGRTLHTKLKMIHESIKNIKLEDVRGDS